MIYKSFSDLFKNHQELSLDYTDDEYLYFIENKDKLLDPVYCIDDHDELKNINLIRHYYHRYIDDLIRKIKNFYDQFSNYWLDIKDSNITGVTEFSKDGCNYLTYLLSDMHISIVDHKHLPDYLEIIKDEINSSDILQSSLRILETYHIFDQHDLDQFDKFIFPNICTDYCAGMYLIDKYLEKTDIEQLNKFWSKYGYC